MISVISKDVLTEQLRPPYQLGPNCWRKFTHLSQQKYASFVYINKSSRHQVSNLLRLSLQPIYYEYKENDFEIRLMTTTKLYSLLNLFVPVVKLNNLHTVRVDQSASDQFQLCMSAAQTSLTLILKTIKPNDLMIKLLVPTPQDCLNRFVDCIPRMIKEYAPEYRKFQLTWALVT